MRTVFPLLFLIGFSQLGHAAIDPSSESWTFLFYVAGDEEEIDRYSRVPIRKLEQVSSQRGRRILAHVDLHLDESGKKKVSEPALRYEIEYHPGSIDPSNYETLKIRSRVVWQSAQETNSSSKQSLQEFIRWGMKYAPSDRYALFILGHAWGWRGAMEDHNPGIAIPPNTPEVKYLRVSLYELGSALEEGSGGRKLDLLVMDVCNGGVLELLYEVKDRVRVLVATPSEMPFMSFDYEKTLKRPFEGVRRFAKDLVGDILVSFARGGSQVEDEGDHPALSMIAIDMERFSPFWFQWKRFTSEIDRKFFRNMFLGQNNDQWTDPDLNADLIEVISTLGRADKRLSGMAKGLLKGLEGLSSPKSVDSEPMRFKTVDIDMMKLVVQGDEIPSEEESLKNAEEQFAYLNPSLKDLKWKVFSTASKREFHIEIPVRSTTLLLRPYLSGTTWGHYKLYRRGRFLAKDSFKHPVTYSLNRSYSNESPFLALGHTFGAGRFSGLSLSLDSIVDPMKPENYHLWGERWIGGKAFYRSISFSNTFGWGGLLFQ